jgi:hypothetical protein
VSTVVRTALIVNGPFDHGDWEANEFKAAYKIGPGDLCLPASTGTFCGSVVTDITNSPGPQTVTTRKPLYLRVRSGPGGLILNFQPTQPGILHLSLALKQVGKFGGREIFWERLIGPRRIKITVADMPEIASEWVFITLYEALERSTPVTIGIDRITDGTPAPSETPEPTALPGRTEYPVLVRGIRWDMVGVALIAVITYALAVGGTWWAARRWCCRGRAAGEVVEA